MTERRKAPKVAKGNLRVSGFKIPKDLTQLKSLLAKDGLGSKTIHEIEPGQLGFGSDINQRQYVIFRKIEPAKIYVISKGSKRALVLSDGDDEGDENNVIQKATDAPAFARKAAKTILGGTPSGKHHVSLAWFLADSVVCSCYSTQHENALPFSNQKPE
ncbi:hypothetical protein M752DRAFT_294054 [Aspergillus phoenicis ATCC 13157]|uniref:Uncharacterized protein n=1 Tax=Aspergillus phoenicis ATCC 13157 TaxID=1353007 RepID=A0A370PIQ4_ASPPH|nr:hypothetical protein M752DRAFT_294054 [Aspergillus phoenicis ATCC 13157]